MTPSVPDYLNPIQWHQAVAVSRQECARIFRDGGAPLVSVRDATANLIVLDAIRAAAESGRTVAVDLSALG